jgi:hypothetical protein
MSYLRLTLAAASLCALLTGCAAAPSPAAPPPPAAPAPIPSVSLAPRVVEMASAYRRYVDTAAAISPGFADGSAVANALRSGAAYEPLQLQQGAVAYGAVVALQDKAFVTAVRAYAVDPVQRRQVAHGIMENPAFVLGIPGAAGAAGLVAGALGEDGRKLYDQGKRVKQAAYDVQRASWSKADVSGRPARLSQAKSLSATPGMGDLELTARLGRAVVGAEPLTLTPGTATLPYSASVTGALAVAALAALGYADETHLPQVTALLADRTASTCMNMSKLNLYQCLAVAKPHYEDVFCLGQHALMDTGQCVMRGAGLPPVVEVAPKPMTVAGDSAKAGSRGTQAKTR